MFISIPKDAPLHGGPPQCSERCYSEEMYHIGQQAAAENKKSHKLPAKMVKMDWLRGWKFHHLLLRFFQSLACLFPNVCSQQIYSFFSPPHAGILLVRQLWGWPEALLPSIGGNPKPLSGHWERPNSPTHLLLIILKLLFCQLCSFCIRFSLHFDLVFFPAMYILPSQIYGHWINKVCVIKS